MMPDGHTVRGVRDAVHFLAHFGDETGDCRIFRELLLEINIEADVLHHQVRLQHELEIMQQLGHRPEIVCLSTPPGRRRCETAPGDHP